MSEKQKILVILTPGFPANEDDTTCLPERQVFVRSLVRNYPAVKIIILTFQYPFKKEKYNWYGAEVISFNGREKGKLFRLFTWIKVEKALRHLQKKYRIIGVLSFWLGECSFIAKRFAKRHGLKHYSCILGQDAKKGNRYMRMINPEPQNLIALSDFIAEELHKNYGIRPAHVIPPGIDASYFPKVIYERTIHILGVGSLIELKQFGIFISIVKDLVTHDPSVKTVICGKGPELKKLEKMINENELKENIRIIEGLPHNEVLKLMLQSKILLHPSSYEGFGMVCLEALYAGAKVISFCKPMNKEIAGWHIVKNENEMMQRAMELLSQARFSHERSMPFDIKTATASVMKLFDE